MIPEKEWIECWACGGSGEDDVNWDGYCSYCGGSNRTRPNRAAQRNRTQVGHNHE